MAAVLVSTSFSTTPEADVGDGYASFAQPGIVSLIVSLTALPVILYLFVRLLLIAKSKRVNFKRSDQIMALLTFTLYLAYSTHVIIESLYALLHSADDFNASMCIFKYQQGKWLAFGKLSAYLFFLCRLYHTFAGSMFAVSYRKAMVAAISMIITFLFCRWWFDYVTYFPMRYIARMGDTEDDAFTIQSFEDCSVLLQREAADRYKLIGVAVALNILWDLVVSIFILRAFITKLTVLSIAFKEIDVWVQKKQIKTSKNQRRHQKNAFFLSLTIRTTNIVILSTVSAYFGIFVLGARIGEYWLIIDQVTRLIAIYMMYSKETYERICCCNDCCYSCCAQICYCCCLKPRQLPQHLQLEIDQQCNVEETAKADLETADPTSTGNVHSPSVSTESVSSEKSIPVLTDAVSIFSTEMDSQLNAGDMDGHAANSNAIGSRTDDGHVVDVEMHA